jgi:hypothetical protein
VSADVRRTSGATRATQARPPLWLRTSVPVGVVSQGGAAALGAGLIAVAADLDRLGVDLRGAALIVGFVLVYLNTHAVAHWFVGRIVGIRFQGFGLRGTDHPENYPPGLRHLMGALPMWVAMTDPESRHRASPRALAAMYAAGETSTTVCSVAAASAAFLAHVPWALGLLVFAVLWNLGASIVVSVIDKGDYAKARRALRAR